MNKTSNILKCHSLLSYQMLNNLIDTCPDNLWIKEDENESIWKRILHVLESVDFWLNDFSDYNFKGFLEDFTAEMDMTNTTNLSKKEISSYSKLINNKIHSFFDIMNDIKLLETSKKHPNVTFLDIVLSQIRHIQINIGYCNEKLNSNGYKSVEWIGYNE